MSKPKPNIGKAEIRARVVEMRADTEARKLEGYAAVFNEYSENLGGYFEIIESNAFDDVMSDDVRCVLNHDPNIVLGRTGAGTLTLSTDSKGLKFVCQLPDTQQARDLMELVNRGDINQCSFKFSIKEDDWVDEEDRGWVRTIKKVRKLYDVGPVTFPAYSTTDVSVRSFEEAKSKTEIKTNKHNIKILRQRQQLRAKRWDFDHNGEAKKVG